MFRQLPIALDPMHDLDAAHAARLRAGVRIGLQFLLLPAYRVPFLLGALAGLLKLLLGTCNLLQLCVAEIEAAGGLVPGGSELAPLRPEDVFFPSANR